MFSLTLIALLHAQEPTPSAPATPAPTEAPAGSAAPEGAPAPSEAVTPVAAPVAEPVATPAAKAEEEKHGLDMTPAGLWKSMGTAARLVFLLMVGMLLWSVYVAFDRVLLFVRSRAQSRQLAAAVVAPLQKADVDSAIKLCESEGYKLSYLGTILKAALKEYKARYDHHSAEAAHRAIERVTLIETANLRKGMAVLATTGSTTPFVGLVGTIFGIINAFAMMNSEGGGDLTAISGGIAEALVSTAAGIAVAIVAIWLYNYFNGVIDDIINDMSTASQELEDFMEKDVLRRAESRAAK